MIDALLNSGEFPCTDVLLREVSSTGPEDSYEVLAPRRSIRLLCFHSTHGPGSGHALSCALSGRERSGESVGGDVTIGSRGTTARKHCHRYWSEGDSGAIVARVAILRHLQRRGLAPPGASGKAFEVAAAMPFVRRFENEAELEAFGRFFNSL